MPANLVATAFTTLIAGMARSYRVFAILVKCPG